MPGVVRCCAMLVAVLGACGGDSTDPTEVVIADASLGGAAPSVLGATSTTVFWSASTRIGGGSLASLPAAGAELAVASGPVAHAGEHVVFVADGNISHVDIEGVVQRITTGAPDAVAGNAAASPVVVWTTGPMVEWGVDDPQMTTSLPRIDRCDHLRVTAKQIYVAADGASTRRLLRIDQQTGDITAITASSTWAPMFPHGGTAGATYRGRIVDADDEGVLWLVEEMPTERGLLVSAPMQGDASVLLDHVSGASGFFASETALYWQEGDELLTAPRTGGAASIVASLPGPAGGFADGYVYFTNGAAIERLRVE
jgi:hypothetical protein